MDLSRHVPPGLFNTTPCLLLPYPMVRLGTLWTKSCPRCPMVDLGVSGPSSDVPIPSSRSTVPTVTGVVVHTTRVNEDDRGDELEGPRLSLETG